MNAHRSRPSSVAWPPILIIGLTALAVLANMVAPLNFGFAGTRPMGIALIASATGIDVWAMKTLIDAKTTLMPNRRSSHLVTHGPFGHSRNPIYLANIMLMAGLGLFFNNGWLLLLAPACAVLTHLLAIKREENHLLALFGYEYETYCRRVRRWI